MRLYLLFWKWKIYGFCLFEGVSFQKQGFYAHSGMAKFSLFGISMKAKYLKKIIAWNIMGTWILRVEWIQAWFWLMACTYPICILRLSSVHRGPEQPGNSQCAAGQHEEQRTLFCCLFCAWREHGGLHTLIAADLSPHPYEVFFSVWLFTCLLFGLRSVLPSAKVCNTELSTAAPSHACGSGIELAVAGRTFACLTSRVWVVHVFALFLLSAAEEGKWGGVCMQPLTQGWGKRRWPPREGMQRAPKLNWVLGVMWKTSARP